MKKLKQSLFLMFFAASILTGCNLSTVKTDDLLDPPDVSASKGGVTLVIYRYSSDTKYINIYRKDLTSCTEDEATVEKIGIVYPGGFDSSKQSYTLEDQWIYSNHKYKYMVRYAEDETYYNSDWSSEVITTAGYSSDQELKYTSNAKFHFDSTDSTLKISGTITNPTITDFDTEWTPMLAVKTTSKTDSISQLYKISSIENGTVINLRGVLSSDFLNTEIEILGIVGQKEIKSSTTDGSTPVTQWLIWTDITKIPISGNSENKITITSETGTNGYDYS